MSAFQIQEHFQELYSQFLSEVSDIKCSVDNFMQLLVRAMENVEHYALRIKKTIVIHGLQKKELVQDLILKYYAEFKAWEEVEKLKFEGLKNHLQVVMDKFIDILVSAAKGQMVFKVALEETRKNCITCFGGSTKTIANKPIYKPKDVAEVNALVTSIYDQVRASIVNKQFGMNNIMSLVTIVMQAVGQAVALTGPEKKEVAMQVIRKLIAEIPLPDSERETISAIIEGTVSKAIDFIIMAANGQLDFGKMAEQFKTTFACCFKKNTA